MLYIYIYIRTPIMSRVIGYGLFLHQCYKLSIHVQRYTFPVVKYK
jgi:hypothetical protein